MGELYSVTPEGKYEKIANGVGNLLADGGTVRPEVLFRLDDEVTFKVKLSKNDCKRLIRVFGMKKPQLVGRRIAKRKNRLRRLARWKTGKTYHGIIKKIVRRYNKIIKTPLVYCSTENGLNEISFTEAAERLRLADPSPSVPVLFVMDKSDAEEWKRAGTRQQPDEWNPDEREAQP